MAEMSAFEQLANDIDVALTVSRQRIQDFGYGTDPDRVLSILRASVVIWLVSTEENRHHPHNFRQGVIDRLPLQDDLAWDNYIQPAPHSSLRQRMESYWGIRIAYTHADGDLTKIANLGNRTFASNVPTYLPGCSIQNDWLNVSALSLHELIRSFTQVRDLLV